MSSNTQLEAGNAKPVPQWVPTTPSPPPLPVPNREHNTRAVDISARKPVPPRSMWTEAGVRHPQPTRAVETELGFSLKEYVDGEDIDLEAGVVEQEIDMDGARRTQAVRVQAVPEGAKRGRVPVPPFRIDHRGELTKAAVAEGGEWSPGPWPVSAAGSDVWHSDDIV